MNHVWNTFCNKEFIWLAKASLARSKCTARGSIAPLISFIIMILIVKWKVGYSCSASERTAAPPPRQRKHVLERDSLFHFTAYNRIYFNLENEGLFSNSLPLHRWEVWCHPAGMCNPSIPPTLLHPGACKPLGIPSSLIKKKKAGGWLFKHYLAFLHTVISQRHSQIAFHVELWHVSSLLTSPAKSWLGHFLC